MTIVVSDDTIRRQLRSGHNAKFKGAKEVKKNHHVVSRGHSVQVKRRYSTGGVIPANYQSQACYVGDNDYPSIAEAARAENMKDNKLRERLKRGATHYRGLAIGFGSAATGKEAS